MKKGLRDQALFLCIALRTADYFELRTSDYSELRTFWYGQGEIRTLDTGFTGMPVFETGAFNHSATCPALEKYRVAPTRTTARNGMNCDTKLRSRYPPRLKKLCEQVATFIGQYSALNFWRMIETWMSKEITDRSRHPCLWIPCSEYNTADA